VGLLDGKVAIIFGVRNQRGLGWQVARAFGAEGARLAITCREHSRHRVEPLLPALGRAELRLCDVQNDEDVARAFAALRERHGGVDAVVHSLADANREDVSGRRYVETSRAGFALALEVSAYSLTLIAREAEPLLAARGGGSIVAMTYLGSERVIPNYNVMGVAKAALECSVRYLAHDLGPRGIRVNAISAGPIRTLAARAVAGFPAMERHAAARAPLRRNASGSDVAAAALHLCSDLGHAISGAVLHVDAGYHSGAS
jgi:enoyl-[acyl-carrier protein] reductase I